MKLLKSLFPEWSPQWLDGLFVTLVIGAIVGLLRIVSINISFFDPVSRALDGMTLSDIYFALTPQKNVSKDMSCVSVVDISGLNSRSEIADVIQAVNAQEPAMVVLDAIFPNVSVIQKDENDKLVTALEETNDLLIACKAADSKHTEHSFFQDSIKSVEGYVNFDVGMQRYAGTCFNGDTTRENMAFVIARKMGFVNKHCEPVLINYSRLYVPVFDKETIDKRLCGQVVIIGDMRDLRDYHLTPVSNSNGEFRMSGSMILAYMVNSYSPQRRITISPLWLNLMLAVILTYLLSALLACYIFNHCERFNGLLISIISFVLLLLFMPLGYALMQADIYVNLGHTMLWVSLVSFATELYFFIKEKIINIVKKYLPKIFKKK